jgi:hypothetical protein
MPSNVLGSSIAFIAVIARAEPPLGMHNLVLGALRNFYFWDPLRFAKLWTFDFLARMVFEGRLWVSVRHVRQLLW